MGCVPLASLPAVRPLCASLVLATSIAAQSLGDWRSVPSRTVPPARTGFALAELPGGDLLLFGGDAANPQATEWRWNGFDWSAETTPVPRRDQPAMASLPTSLMVFGGVANGTVLSDTWLRSPNGVWTQVSSQVGALTDVSIAGDVAGQRYVLVGRDFAGDYQTWFYELTWTQGPTVQTFGARVVADDLRRRVLLITDDFASTGVSVLDGTSWSSYAQAPSSVALGDVAFDRRRGHAVLLQPFDDLQVVEWDGLALQSSGTPTGGILSANATAMSYHQRRDEVVLVANRGNGMETLRHAVDSEPAALAFGTPCGRSLELSPGSIPLPGATHALQSATPVGDLSFGVIGFSRTTSSGQPLPQPLPGGCLLEVEPAIATFLGSSADPKLFVSLPSSAQLLGERYVSQFVFLVSGGGIASSNGLEVQIGSPPFEFELRETFVDDSNRDPIASGDVWGNGSAVPAQIGGDGAFGSFDLSLATQVAANVYELDTDMTVIPADRTLSGLPAQVTDGRFYFTDFVVPAGVTLRFVGTSPARLFVRGVVDVQGTVSVDAPDMPSTIQTAGPALGLPVSTFNARIGGVGSPGQPGGAGGPGGGRGGNGGVECGNLGPILSNGVDVTSGQDGIDVQVGAGHAYEGSVGGTGGAGSPLMPATGLWAGPPFPTLSFVYSPYHSRGGNGGGFRQPGGVSQQPQHANPNNTILFDPAQAASPSFPLFPLPGGTSSLEHFAVGGSGGGGGGSHGYGLLAIGSALERWMSGHGGAGGGGVLVLRAGNVATVAGALTSRGGSGPIIAGDDPNTTSTTDVYGISSPGGGGSGGSVLLQARVASVSGSVDVRGGTGGVNDYMANSLQRMTGGGGDGAPGFLRIETQGGLTFSGSYSSPFVNGENSGTLQDVDARTGSRSRWMTPSSTGLPVWLRYELLVQINGLPVLFSDDPEVSPVAATGANSAATLLVQGARLDALGQPLAGTIGPWRGRVGGPGSLNTDFAQAVRFDVVLDKSLGAERVLDLRIVWR